MSWLEDNQKKIEKLIDYSFNNPNLLMQAFTRRSYKEEHKLNEQIDDNEVLEFVGDRALDLIVTKVLTNKFTISEYNPDWITFKQKYLVNKPKEALFTEIKEDLVRTESLSQIINKLKWHTLLLMSNGDYNQQVNNDDHVKEDLFEAIIGAVTIDCNYDLKTIEKVVKNLIDFNTYFDHYHQQTVNYISLVNEWANKNAITLPDFDDWECENVNNEWNYHKQVNFDIPGIGMKTFIINNQPNKQEARYELAKKIYECLAKHHLLYQKEKITIDLSKDPISQIYELSQLNKIKKPTFEFSSEGLDHQLEWTCKLIDENKKTFNGSGSTKKDAQRQAALSYLQYLSSNND